MSSFAKGNPFSLFFFGPLFLGPLVFFFLFFLSPAKVGSLEMQPGAKLQAYLGVFGKLKGGAAIWRHSLVMLAYTAPDKMVVSRNDVKRSFSNKECLMKIQEYEKIRNIVVQMANAQGQSLQPWERLRLPGEFDCACAAVVLDKKHKDWPLKPPKLVCRAAPKPFDEPKPTGRGLTPSSRGAACSSKETLPKPALAGSSVRIRKLADGSLADTPGLSDKGFSAGVKVVDKKSKNRRRRTDLQRARCDSGSLKQ